MRNTLVPLAAVLVLAGCAGLPRHVHKSPSTAFEQPETTTLGRIVAAEDVGKSLSGIRLLSTGEEALASLIALADHAERTLDIQYYIIHEDDSSRALLHHVRLAADRGVRVRVLIDDLNTAGEDRRYLHLSTHVNVEVRVFNPFTAGRFATWTRLLASATNIRRINHRMHNKLFVADDALAITGGRNIGDQYFTLDPRSNFVDLDVVAAGAIVPQLSASFDQFWNSKYAFPIASVAASVDAEAASAPPVEPQTSDKDRWLAQAIDAQKLDLIWAPATVLADQPAKITSETSPNEELTIANDITALMATAKQDLSIISPYFVPGKQGVALIAKLVENGVHVRILTNSLASTDSPLVDIGYARYRVALLKLGVELREMRPKLGQKHARFHPFRSSNASLHAKALVIDQKIVFIGSLNMDERSRKINSELGLVISSAEVAHEVTGLLDDISSADGSFKLQLDRHGRVEWVSGDVGSQKVWHTEPETSRTERVWLAILSPFAPDELL
jgi:putative cardiolipin synthase